MLLFALLLLLCVLLVALPCSCARSCSAPLSAAAKQSTNQQCERSEGPLSSSGRPGATLSWCVCQLQHHQSPISFAPFFFRSVFILFFTPPPHARTPHAHLHTTARTPAPPALGQKTLV